MIKYPAKPTARLQLDDLIDRQYDALSNPVAVAE
jgi:hypothetical protein